MPSAVLNVYSLSSAARVLGVDRRTVADIARLLGITPGPHPSNGNGKALTIPEFRRIERALGRVRKMAVSA